MDGKTLEIIIKAITKGKLNEEEVQALVVAFREILKSELDEWFTDPNAKLKSVASKVLPDEDMAG